VSTVCRTFSVDAPPEVVIPYLADFGNAEQWDPGTVRCVRIDDGPVAVGASWQNTSKIAGITTELTYTLEQLTDERIVLAGRNDTATSTETIVIARDAPGSRITYTNEVQFNGVARLAGPLAKIVFEKLGDDTEKKLVHALNALQA
jgi:Polyketide cyclase / dehydrase and lipid transport